MYVLGLDLETTGVDVARDSIVEMGAVVWDVSKKKPVSMYNELVTIAPKKMPPEIVELIGITDDDLDRWGKPLKQVLEEVAVLAQSCDYIVAHNAHGFDKIVLDRHLSQFPEIEIKKPWIDTLNDVPYPEHIKTRKLSYLAAEHGFLNPFAHRAVFDVLTTLRVFSAYDIDEILKLQSSPLVRVVAEVTFDERDKARENGFRWDRNNRQWFVELKQVQLDEKSFPFGVTIELS